MSETMHGRRRLLLSTAAWVGGLAAVAANRPARGFQVEEMPPASAVGRAYAERCGGTAEHAALIARWQALLIEDPFCRLADGDLRDLRLPSRRHPLAAPANALGDPSWIIDFPRRAARQCVRSVTTSTTCGPPGRQGGPRCRSGAPPLP